MTTETMKAWEATLPRDPHEALELVWHEIAARRPAYEKLEAGFEIIGDDFYGLVLARVHDAFRAGFAAAGVVARLGYPPATDYERILQAIVREAEIEQIDVSRS